MLPTVLRRIYRPTIMRTGMLHILLDSILRRLTIKVVRRLNFRYCLYDVTIHF